MKCRGKSAQVRNTISPSRLSPIKLTDVLIRYEAQQYMEKNKVKSRYKQSRTAKFAKNPYVQEKKDLDQKADRRQSNTTVSSPLKNQVLANALTITEQQNSSNSKQMLQNCILGLKRQKYAPRSTRDQSPAENST